MSLLAIEGVSRSFGGIKAVDAVSLSVDDGELVGLIGPNGSGKTTLLNILSGFERADAGLVHLGGRRVNGLAPERLARGGIVRMFQLTRMFPRMNVVDNLLVAGRALGLSHGTAVARASLLLDELSLSQVAHLDAGRLSGGQLKLLEFGACFMVPPKVALLDEPFAAIHPTMKEIMAGYIRRAHAAGQTFLVVSHDMPVIVELCPRSICMNAGRVIADGDTRSVLNLPVVIESYLGGAAT
jgi:branched-chain amino acid transport system ATP-binding protein